MPAVVGVSIDGIGLGQGVKYGSISIANQSSAAASASFTVYDPTGRWAPHLGDSVEIKRIEPGAQHFLGNEIIGNEALGDHEIETFVYFGGSIRRFRIEEITHAAIRGHVSSFLGNEIIGNEALGNQAEAWYWPRWIHIDCTDYSFLFERYLINRTWTSKTLLQIVTDVVTDMADFDITVTNVQTGPTIAAYEASYVSATKILNDLAAISGYVWWVDKSQNLYFAPKNTTFAPFAIDDQTGMFDEMEIEVSDDEYRNKVTVVRDDGSVRTRSDTAEITSRGTWWKREEARGLTTDAGADEYGDGLLRQFAREPRVAKISTQQHGLRVGQQIAVNRPALGLVGAYLVHALRTRIEHETVTRAGVNTALVRYEVDISDAERIPNYLEYFQRKLRS